MHDPVGVFLRIRELYLSYLDTAFRIEDKHIAEARRHLMRTPGQLCTSPLLEPQPRWKSYAYNFESIAASQDGEDPVLGDMPERARKAFCELMATGLMRTTSAQGEALARTPFTHQAAMLRRGIHKRRATIVTSGTGSGKTEAFLMPVIASIIEEATRDQGGWMPPNHDFLKHYWWRYADGSPRMFPNENGEYKPDQATSKELSGRALTWDGYTSVRRRTGETRPSAIRALILYPMNALVEDQMSRLRAALDSREARACLDKHLDGNRIFFGRYTGSTKGGPEFLREHERQIGMLSRDDLKSKSFADIIPNCPPPTTDLSKWKDSLSRKRKQRILDTMGEMCFLDDLQSRIRNDSDLPGLPVGAGDPKELQDKAFSFPSVDGSELITRWEMQETPPDILVTNISMLNAMLSRQTEARMLDETKKWLQSDTRNVFTLVIDELHLQRGSEGTEFIYLLRLLISRLGLNQTDRHDQLRILASSASLPIGQQQGEKSLDYLWDAFHSFGLDPNATREDWEEAILSGDPEPLENLENIPPDLLNSERISEAVQYAEKSIWTEQTSDQLLRTPDFSLRESEVKILLDLLGIPFIDDPELRWLKAAKFIGTLIEHHCIEEGTGRVVATTFESLAVHIWPAHCWSMEEVENNMRMLCAIVGSIDETNTIGASLMERARKEKLALPRFRVHTFFKSPEGLFSDVRPYGFRLADHNKGWIGSLSMDRSGKSTAVGNKDREVRIFELLYCECCGELMIGGIRGGEGSGYLGEILPTEAQIERLPDLPLSDRFEELSYQQYVLLWPHDTASRGARVPSEPERQEERWIPALLDTETGIIFQNGTIQQDSFQKVFLFERTPGTPSASVYANDRAGSHVPCACPNCGTDYGPKRSRARNGQRVSPIRNFRAGFAKTTQLLASELFDVLSREGDSANARLVSFSDSRQDASRTAMNIEARRHEDVLREILFAELQNSSVMHSDRLAELVRIVTVTSNAIENMTVAGLLDAIPPLEKQLKVNQLELAHVNNRIIPLSYLLEVSVPSPGDKVKPFFRNLLRLGIHPWDERGLAQLESTGSDDEFQWWKLFQKGINGDYLWAIVPGSGVNEQNFPSLSGELIRKACAAVGDVIFSPTYFSLEASGVAYPCPLPPPSWIRDGQLDQELFSHASAWIRIYADHYKYDPTGSEFDTDRNYIAPSTIATSRSKFAKLLRNTLSPALDRGAVEFFTEGQSLLMDSGHSCANWDRIRISNLGFKLPNGGDKVIRCSNCSRVHLHAGFGVCTRCGSSFNLDIISDSVSAHLMGNFVGRRLSRSSTAGNGDPDIFRLRCEELTAQTIDPAERQREFKGIYLANQAKCIIPPGIDMLAVTTTMEVGVDIGPLQAVIQANMPPQRFNYQQRVGRAGRRDQAFSFVLTLCRSKSHDLHYFLSPEEITGDPPPPPFLVKGLSRIADRLITKDWLIRAFALLREEFHERSLIWPGLVVTPIDVHGDFLPMSIMRDEIFKSTWKVHLTRALEATRIDAQETVLLFERGRIHSEQDIEPLSLPDSSVLIDSIFDSTKAGSSNLPGMASHLADQGVLPMYGLPTRVRELVIGKDSIGEPRTLSRDLEIAISEFAPGNVLVHDKMEHLCIGLTPRLMRRGNKMIASPGSLPFDRVFFLSECPYCGSITSVEPPLNGINEGTEFECISCRNPVLNWNDHVQTCWEPAEFRTDFYPRSRIEKLPSGGRSLCADARPPIRDRWNSHIQKDSLYEIGLQWNFYDQSVVYRLNRGFIQNDRPIGFPILSMLGRDGWLRGASPNRASGSGFSLANQSIDRRLIDDTSLGLKSILISDDGSVNSSDRNVVLAAKRVTDGLYLLPNSLNPLLALDRLGATDLPHPHPQLNIHDSSHNFDLATAQRYWQGVRAAAISASQMIVTEATRRLDVDRSAIEALEPRMMLFDNLRLPLLQFVDEHANGAGFSAWIGRSDVGCPPIFSLVDSILSQDRKGSFFTEKHISNCKDACYSCLKSYDNQQLHGLLDWRLGMAFLRAFCDPTWACGLDGKLDWHPISSWASDAERLSRKAVTLWGGDPDKDVRSYRPPSFEFDLYSFRLQREGGATPWIIIRHPLWAWSDEPVGPLAAFMDNLRAYDGESPLCWDSFNLERRIGRSRQWILSTCMNRVIPASSRPKPSSGSNT